MLSFSIAVAEEPVTPAVDNPALEQPLSAADWSTLHEEYAGHQKRSKKWEIAGWSLVGVGVLAAPNYLGPEYSTDERVQYLLTCGAMIGVGIPLGVVHRRKRLEAADKVALLDANPPALDASGALPYTPTTSTSTSSTTSTSSKSKPADGCCRHCASGKPCGDSCIAANKECHTPGGCACY